MEGVEDICSQYLCVCKEEEWRSGGGEEKREEGEKRIREKRKKER